MVDAIERGAGAEGFEISVAVIAQFAIGGNHCPLTAPPDWLPFFAHRSLSFWFNCESFASADTLEAGPQGCKRQDHFLCQSIMDGGRLVGYQAQGQMEGLVMVVAHETDWDRDAALTTARILLDIKAVNVRPDEPYTLTSGWKSPVYVDCRKIIYFPRARAKICDLAVEKLGRKIGFETIEAVAGGETAGIPFAAWIAERMAAPMAYVRKKPKGFGRNAQIEGDVPVGRNTLLVEDLTTDGQSKIRFAQALRDAGAICEHTFVVFYYGVFPGSFETLSAMNVTLHHLCTWWDVLAACEERGDFTPEALAEARRFLSDPVSWSAARGGVASMEEAARTRSGS